MAKCIKCDYPYATAINCPNCGNDNPSGKWENDDVDTKWDDPIFDIILAGVLSFPFFYYFGFGNTSMHFTGLFLYVVVMLTKSRIKKIVYGVVLLTLLIIFGRTGFSDKKYVHLGLDGISRSIEFVNNYECLYIHSLDSVKGIYDKNLFDDKIVFEWGRNKKGKSLPREVWIHDGYLNFSTESYYMK